MQTRKKWDEETVLRLISEGTATTVGGDFFNALVQHLASALQIACAFVTEFTEVNTRVRTLAFWYKGALQPNIEYGLADTPCEAVLNGQFCHYPNSVRELFPRDLGLVRLGIESFLGVPLFNAQGAVMGHLAVLDNRPLPSEPQCLSIFKIFADRARAELERQHTNKKLLDSEERLSRILASALDAIITIDSNKQILLSNRAAEQAFGTTQQHLLGDNITSWLSNDLNNIVDNYIQANTKPETPYIWLPPGLTAKRANGQEFPLEGTLSCAKSAHQNLYTLILRDINEHKQAQAELHRLQLENSYLQEELQTTYNFEEMVGISPSISKIFGKIDQVATTDATCLIIGETGTGKELIARAIHNRSRRKDRPLIKVNCAALSAGLIESEFFGHEKGAFTGAIAQRIGRFELANGGTIFLDEIGDISLEVQVKLLRVLQEQEFERVGGKKTIKVDVRVIAATNRDLAQMVKEGLFRADLYYRLNVFPLYLPALRERKTDLALLMRYFVSKYTVRMGKKITQIAPTTIQYLTNYHWPGNIRELENVIERAVILAEGSILQIDEDLLHHKILPSTTSQTAVEGQPQSLQSLEEIERAHILKVLTQVGWVIEGAKGAAQILGMNPNTLRSRMQKLGIKRPTVTA